jgi:hypothetical protein
MAGLNNIREAYQQIYSEALSADEKALRRELAADKRASKMDSKIGAKYASSERRSAEREDKKSKGKHIHGMADSYEIEGDIVEKKDDSYLETDMKKRRENNEKAVEDMKKTKAHADMVKAARKHFGEESYMEYSKRKQAEKKDTRMTVTAADKKGNTTAWQQYQKGNPKYKAASHVGEEAIVERELDPTETREKERLVKGLKKSASDFKKRYGSRAKSVMYATATKMAKDRMDTSKSDRRYGVEG